MRKFFKVIFILVLVVILLAAATFGVLHYKYDSSIPEGQSGAAADAFACQILEALNESDYLEARYVEWSFRGADYKWDKRKQVATCSWSNFYVELHFMNSDSNTAFKNSQRLTGKEEQRAIDKATDKFNNDSFWVLAPFKLFEKGTTRKLVTFNSGKKGLLIHYKTGGSTPGDSYLWQVNDLFIPTSYKMWVSIIPIGGLEAKWSAWTVTDSGAKVAMEKSILGIALPISNIKIYSNAEDALFEMPLRDDIELNLKSNDVSAVEGKIKKDTLIITRAMRRQALNKYFSQRHLERDINFIRPLLNEAQINILAENIMLLQQTNKNIFKLTYNDILALKMRDSLY